MLMMLTLDGFGGPNLGQPTPMMLAWVALWPKPGAADAHDAGFGWFWGRSLGQLMLMMLGLGGFVAETVGS